MKTTPQMSQTVGVGAARNSVLSRISDETATISISIVVLPVLKANRFSMSALHLFDMKITVKSDAGM